MTANACMVCGASLSLREGRAFCSNDDCPSGGLFLRCGYCRSFSFSINPEQMSCANESCRMHEVRRSFCQVCSKTSQIDHDGRKVCINRACASNSKIISSCFFCAKRSFLGSPETMFCTKGDCPYLLRRMERCFACKETAYEQEEARCRNDRCAYHNVRIEPCPSCGSLSLVQEEGHERSGRCLDDDCDLSRQAEVDAPSTLGLDAERSAPVAPPAPEEPVEDPFHRERERVLAEETEVDAIPPPPRPKPAAAEAGPAPPPPPDPSAFPPRHSEDDFSIPLPRALVKPTEPPTRISPSGRLVATPRVEEAPTKTAAPPPTAPQAPEAAPGEPPADDREESSRAAFRFLQDRILTDENGVAYPLYPVIGLAGSGKTTYLALLGDILTHRAHRYHFPWIGVDAKRVEIDRLLDEVSHPVPSDLGDRIGDLVYDFAPDALGGFVGKGQWAQPSRSCRFLVGQVTRRGRLVAQVASVEAGGAEYDATLRGLRERLRGRGEDGAAQEAIAELLRRADGIVILIDPANEENAEVYLDFFRLLGEALAPRAFKRFRNEVKRRIGKVRGDPPKDKDLDEVLADLLREGESGGKVSSGDETMLVEDRLAEIRHKASAVVDDVRSDLDLDPALPLVTSGTSPSEGAEAPFSGLRHIAMVITKSDMYPVVCPPDHYPDQKMQKCRPAITALAGYLKLCGGGIRYYNASSSGYSILRDTIYYPGKENTLTPINVAEPIFDMLEI